MENWQLQQKQGLPLEQKIQLTKLRIEKWYEHLDGDVYASFSGGKDSTVMLHIIRSMYPHVPAVYSDTGLEHPEIRMFVKSFNNVVWLKPKMSFQEVIEKHGYPVISKEIAVTIEYARKGSKWALDRINGLHDYGNHEKYKFLLDSPFKISDKCCHEMKKEPFRLFESESKLKPLIGTMASEGGQRESAYKKTGCNAFNSKKPKSVPMGFWTEKDIWDYIKLYNVPYSKIYDMGYDRTGCMFCMFSIMLDGEPNRFQRMAITHPNQHKYCINDMGCGKVLDFIKIPYLPNLTSRKDMNGDKYQQFKMII